MRRRRTAHWPREALPILLAVARARETAVRYRPTAWFRQKGTPVRRQRWSRWTRQLAQLGWLERITEPNRDRVTHVRLTEAGHGWLDSLAGPAEDRDIAFDLSSFPPALSPPVFESEEVFP